MAKKATPINTPKMRTHKVGAVVGKAGKAVKAGLKEGYSGARFMSKLLLKTAKDAGRSTKTLGKDFVGGVRDGYRS